MIHIAITQAAFDSIAATMPFGTVNYEPQPIPQFYARGGAGDPVI
jgi:hypothetical protein